MLQFPYRNLLKSYEYNQTAFLRDLTKRIDAHEQLSRQSERTEHFHLPIADQTVGETLRKILRNSVNRQKENFNKEWEGAHGAGYPFIRAENGDRETKAIAEEISVTDSSKDGWYHIPDRMCAGKADRETIRMFEKECQQTGRRIPYAVGKQLEDIFINAKADHKQIWAHRTGLSIDGGDLASIANHGLAVPAQGHGLDELPELGYTTTKFTVAPKEVFPENTIRKEAKRKIDGPGSGFVRILILSKKKGIVKGETEMEKQKKPLVIIMGRSGAGKTCVANAMRDAYGWTQIESYTTRPRRSEDETGHHFITEAEFDQIPECDRFAYMEYCGYRYCAKREQLDQADLYVVTPDGYEMIRKAYQDRPFFTVVLTASKAVLQERMKKRGGSTDDKIQERIRRDDAIFQDLHPDIVICTDRRSAEETGRTIFALAEVLMTDHAQP